MADDFLFPNKYVLTNATIANTLEVEKVTIIK